ncbi:phosphoribosylamine--glycine ligase, partial [Pseudomonas amygdali pv. aesculi]
MRKTAAL